MRLNPETDAPAPAMESRWWRDPFYWGIALLLAAYAVVLAMNMEAYAAGPDPSGYLNSARLLAIGKIRTEQRTVPGVDVKGLPPMAFVPYAFRPVGEKQMIPTYPIGLPLAVIAAAHVTGWNLAPHATMLAMALLGILATAWLGCVLGLPGKWAWFGAILLGTSPLYLTMSLVLMSDVPALVCLTCAIAAAWKSRECGLKWAFVAGVAVACGVFVRPTNALAIFPAAMCMGISWRRWGMFCLGGLPGAVLWCLYNRAANGHFFETGYGQVAEPIAAQWIPGGWLFYIRWLPVLLTPVVLFAAALPWLALRGG
ncbi:MAG TPA: hypothetical protein VG733_15255, partial [Chthoniobacteraceae bacterium]|nr:hypothetical protein [Chthoniobacteraceae bacterium]